MKNIRLVGPHYFNSNQGEYDVVAFTALSNVLSLNLGNAFFDCNECHWVYTNPKGVKTTYRSRRELMGGIRTYAYAGQ
jgi:hypothetical protein